MKKLKSIEINIETLLAALESGSIPNCHQEVGTMRARFRQADRSTLKIPLTNGSEEVRVVWEEAL